MEEEDAARAAAMTLRRATALVVSSPPVTPGDLADAVEALLSDIRRFRRSRPPASDDARSRREAYERMLAVGSRALETVVRGRRVAERRGSSGGADAAETAVLLGTRALDAADRALAALLAGGRDTRAEAGASRLADAVLGDALRRIRHLDEAAASRKDR